MSLIILSPETVWNAGLLEFPTAPRKILERGMILPRREAGSGVMIRAIFENQLLRFLAVLMPFGAAAIIWPSQALPISQAPLAMLIVIAFVELRVLRVPLHKREQIGSEDNTERALDTLRFRGRRILSQIAAARGFDSGEVFLVVEQSDMARVPPLTVVSVQLDRGKSRLLPLTKSERKLIRDSLFDSDFTEAQLLKANLRDNTPLRSVSFETRGVSAHARLTALLHQTNEPEDQPA
ncbi:MAG: hypothetical protein HRU31_11755 [Rhodobacteraceae bacterium]|nr:hypothetical protein [Paracoccaceae bacterium]